MKLRSIALLFAGLTAHAQMLSVPANLEAPAGTSLFLKAHAVGTQNYMCLPTGWTFVGPQATLFVNVRFLHHDIPHQVATHFLIANPAENGTPRASWQSSIDSSVVSAKAIANSSDPQYVEQGAIPWLLLQVVAAKPGPAGGSLMTAAAYIQRVHTSGGSMPTTACTVGEISLTPYTADYYFYKMKD